MRLKDVAHINRRVLPETTSPGYSFKYIDISAVDSRGAVSIPDYKTYFDSAPSRARRLAPVGSTVVSTVRTYLQAIAQVPEADEQLVFSTGFAVIEARPNIDGRFLSYACRSQQFVDEVVARSVGVSYPAINPGDLGRISMPVPSLDEQRRIADFLDTETARIDRLDELAASTAGLLAERGRGLIEQVIVGSNASTQKLFRGLHLLRDGTHQPPPRTAIGVPLLTARNISSGTLKLTDQDTFVSPEDADALEASLRIHHRDVLLSVKGTVGATAIVPAGFPRAVLDRNIALLRPQPSLLNEWLIWALRTRNVQDQMKLSIAAAAQPGLPLGAIRELRIPAADIDEQKSQVHEIELIDQRQVELESKMRLQRNLLTERRQALITAAVTGAITV